MNKPGPALINLITVVCAYSTPLLDTSNILLILIQSLQIKHTMSSKHALGVFNIIILLCQ